MPKNSSEFQEIISKNEELLPKQNIDFHYYRNIVGTNHPIFVKIEDIHPGQSRYSFDMVKVKLRTKKKKFRSMRNRNAIFKLHEYKEGILTKEGIILDDGHHSVQESLYLGANSFPVKLIADLSNLSMDKAWIELEKMKRVYLISIDGKKRWPPAKFSHLINDPLRYFIGLTALKLFRDLTIQPKGTAYPLWIKNNQTVKFIEFIMADRLYSSEINFIEKNIYNPPFDSETVEDARKILATDLYIFENYLIDTPIPTDIIVSEYTTKNFRDCQELFKRLGYIP